MSTTPYVQQKVGDSLISPNLGYTNTNRYMHFQIVHICLLRNKPIQPEWFLTTRSHTHESSSWEAVPVLGYKHMHAIGRATYRCVVLRTKGVYYGHPQALLLAFNLYTERQQGKHKY